MTARYLILFLFSYLTTGAFAKDIPAKPNPPQIVNDYAGMLNPEEKDALERKLVTYNDTTSTQIAVVLERSLEGDDVFDYTNRLARGWSIGQKGKDNGILIYAALEDRKIFIQVGRGAEGFLPDAIAKRIIENIIKPAFRQQQYYQALDRATDAIISYGAGEYKADPRSDKDAEGWVGAIIILFIIFFFFILPMIQSYRNRNNKNNDDDNDGGFFGGGRYNERSSRGGWIFLPPIGGGGWTSGGGGGGFGGGGFGGFGGGDFGGGGAGGDW